MAGQVILGEGHRSGWINGEQLAPVKDLHAMAASLATNDDVVLVASDLSPDGVGRVGWKTAKIDKLAGGGNLSKGGAVRLGDNDEFATGVTDPAPGGRTLSSAASKVGMTDKVIEVDLKANHGYLERLSGSCECRHTYSIATEGITSDNSPSIGATDKSRCRGMTLILR